MRNWLAIALLGALVTMGCGRGDTTGGTKDSGPSAGDKTPKSPSPTTGAPSR